MPTIGETVRQSEATPSIRYKFMKQKLKNLLSQKKTVTVLWIILGLVSAIKAIGNPDLYNNYLIYKNVFYHLIQEVTLYGKYKALYFDQNHYGPVFSLVIAPFAILPDWLGVIMWSLANTLILVWAIYQLPLKANKNTLILWICAHEFLTTMLNFQFNPMMTAIIVLSFVFIDKKKDFWAAFLIVLGFYIKLYGIVGLAFFFFSKDKLKLIGSLIFWAVVLFVAPMLISSPEYIVNTYVEWFQRLAIKNSENAVLDSWQDISVMGMYRRIVQNPDVSNLPFLIGGLFLFALPYLKINSYSNKHFRLLMLASVLIFTVIFSSGSESPTYIIAFVGVAIWFVLQKRPYSYSVIALFLFAIFFTTLSPSDLMPKFIREGFIRPYALKALPCLLIWLRIVYEMMTMRPKSSSGDFSRLS